MFNLEPYIEEIKFQCKYSLIAFEDLIQSIETDDEDRTWMSIHSFLISSDNVNKIFFPSTTRKENETEEDVANRRRRGRELRNYFSIGDFSTLYGNKQVRNFFEHFDEHLDKWVQSRTHHKIDLQIGGIYVAYQGEVLRYFDPESFELHITDTQINLLEVKTFVERIYNH